MESIEETLAATIYLFYLDEIHAKLIEETVSYIYTKKDVRLYYDDNHNVMRMIKGKKVFFNIHFIKKLYLSIISKLKGDFDCSNEEHFNSHKAQVFIYIVYFLYEIYDGLYD